MGLCLVVFLALESEVGDGQPSARLPGLIAEVLARKAYGPAAHGALLRFSISLSLRLWISVATHVDFAHARVGWRPLKSHPLISVEGRAPLALELAWVRREPACNPGRSPKFPGAQ